MSVTDDVLKANETYAENFVLGELHAPPAKKLAILACMDARMFLDQILGLKPGDAHVIRNAGGIATDDAIRSLVISHHLLGTQEFIIVNHTDCGMLTFTEDDLINDLEQKTGTPTPDPIHFHAFTDLKANVQQQIARLRSHPWLPDTISIRGFIYDVHTGKLNEVEAKIPVAD